MYAPLRTEWVLSHVRSAITAGGVSQPFCPYECVSDKYRMPNCYTPLEELIYMFGGPWPFSLLLSCTLMLLALLLSTLSVKLLGSGSYGANSIEHQNHRHLPHLLSLSEVCYFLQASLFQLLLLVLSGEIRCSRYISLTFLVCIICCKSRCEEQELKRPKAMFIECTLWVEILSENHGIFLILLLMR